LTLLLLGTVYAIFIMFKFVLLRNDLYYLLTGTLTPHGSGSILSRLYTIFLVSTSVESSGAQTQLLFNLTSQPLHEATVYVIIVLFVSIMIFAAISFVIKRTDDIRPEYLSVGAAGAVYYAAGFQLPIIGFRALQVAFLAVAGVITARSLSKRTVKILLLVVLLTAPVIGVNIVVNTTIGAGGNTQNFHSYEGGEYIIEHDLNTNEYILVYPRAGLPPRFMRQQGERIMDLTDTRTGENNDPSLIVYGARQEHFAARYALECNFSPNSRNVIYDNKVKILDDSIRTNTFSCTAV
jgi:hypothetical protein